MDILCTLQIMETSKYSEVDGHIRGRQIDIEFNEVPNNKPQEIKLHNVATTQQKITFVACYYNFIRFNNLRFG